MAAIEFRRMLDSVEGCGIFNDWSKEERIRLARMGTARVYRSGDVILKQGVKPTNLYLIMKGMAKSYKSPNKSTVLGVKLTEARERAAGFDMKYTYDHTSRDALSHGKLDIHPKATEKHRKIQMSRTHVTVSEAMRYSLGVEIHSLEKELQKAIEAEQKAAEEEPSMDDVVEHVTAKLSEVSTLQWPMLFGEACVSDPENGTSRGTIIADTTLEVLCIHKSQLQTFRVRQNLLERLKYRSVIYPEDEELLKQKEQAEEWEITRQGIVSTMSKVREEYLEPFYV
jgi:CRP-like cAMP-binding protein